VIHLYAFVRGLPETPEGLETVDIGRLTAVVGPPIGDDREAAIRHGVVLQELIESAVAVLPARFGEPLDDADALVAAVRPRLGELESRLDAVAGCVEVTVRVTRADDSPPRAEGGGEYMRARLRAVTAEGAAADSLHALLRHESRCAVVTDAALTHLVHDGCYLVARDHVDAFAGVVESYAAAHPELSFVCTGPWPPASFTGAET
jgi:hypothetical protein